jgi:hypothetical protein
VEEIYAWSFYSQGAEAGRQVSADLFFKEALLRFHDPDPEAGSAVERGKRLAALLAGRRALLILDGLEPLQYPHNEKVYKPGQLKDPGMATMLKLLAVQNSGLCLITSREAVYDLRGYKEPGVTEWKLDRLSQEAGDMKLFLIDYHLEYARLLQEQKKEKEMKEHLEVAEKMIKETGYHRRDKELEELKSFTV